MAQNQFLAMLTLHAKQTAIWAEAVKMEIKGKTVNSQFKDAFIPLCNILNRFNTLVEKNLDKDLHYEYSIYISDICTMLATADTKKATQIMESIKFISENCDAIDTHKDDDLKERVRLISEISDKLMKTPAKELQKVHKQIIKTPLK
jgi:hypothetical protein